MSGMLSHGIDDIFESSFNCLWVEWLICIRFASKINGKTLFYDYALQTCLQLVSRHIKRNGSEIFFAFYMTNKKAILILLLFVHKNQLKSVAVVKETLCRIHHVFMIPFRLFHREFSTLQINFHYFLLLLFVYECLVSLAMLLLLLFDYSDLIKFYW